VLLGPCLGHVAAMLTLYPSQKAALNVTCQIAQEHSF
jgi:hypothetical protein